MGENTDEAGEHEWSLIIDVSGARSILAAGWVGGLVRRKIIRRIINLQIVET